MRAVLLNVHLVQVVIVTLYVPAMRIVCCVELSKEGDTQFYSSISVYIYIGS